MEQCDCEDTQTNELAEFKIWMRAVDSFLYMLSGMKTKDMAYTDYRTMFSQGVTPDEMAKGVLEGNYYPRELIDLP